MNEFTCPDSHTQDVRPVLVLGDVETASMSEMLEHQAGYLLVTIRGSHYFDSGAIAHADSPADVPQVVAALVAATQNGYGIWVPYPQDLGTACDFVSTVGIASNLGIPLYVSLQARPWQSEVLPGLATTEIVSSIGIAWRRFLAHSASELLVTSLSTALHQTGSAAG